MKTSIVHVYIYGMLKRKVNGGNIIQLGEIHPIIKWCVRLPRKYQKIIINEMIEAGLMKKVGRDNYELHSCLRRKAPLDSLGNPLW